MFSLDLGVAHFNHGIRKEDAENDAAFVSSLARDLELPFYMEKRDVPAYKKNTGFPLNRPAGGCGTTFSPCAKDPWI